MAKKKGRRTTNPRGYKHDEPRNRDSKPSRRSTPSTGRDSEQEHLPTPFDYRLHRRNPLKALVTTYQPVYRHFIALIAAGTHPVVAGAAIGIPANLVRYWVQRGKEQARGLYADFWADISLALAGAVAEASQEIRIKNPKEWLAAGPATELFAPEELPVLGFAQGQSGLPGQAPVTINIASPDQISSLSEAIVEMRKLGISLDQPALDPPPEEEQPPSH